MTETASWGTAPWLPERVARQIAAVEARDQAQAQRAEQERVSHHDDLHQRAQMLYKAQAEQRGEDVSALALATGAGGRTAGDVLSEAAAWAAVEDAQAAARAQRDAGKPQPLHVDFGEPVIHAATPARRALLTRSRHFREWQERKRQAEAAKRALEDASRITLADPITLRSAPTSSLESHSARAGGPEPGYGPANVPWSQVGPWLATGWRP